MAWVPLAAAGVSALAGSMSSKGGKGQSQAELPPGFARASGAMGSDIFRFLTGRGGAIHNTPFNASISNALDFYKGLPTNPDIQSALGVYRQDVADPTKLTDPLFKQQSERLAAQLEENSRRQGGLYSTGASDRTNLGLASFYNQYLNDAATRQLQAASALQGGTMQLGQAMFTPFSTFASAIPGLGGASVIPPPQFSNSKGQGFSTAGSILGNYFGSKNYGSKSGSTTTA